MLSLLLRFVLVSLAIIVPTSRIGWWQKPFSTRTCSRPKSSVVRQIIHRDFKPVFVKYNQSMPKQCPLHFSFDFYKTQELEKISYKSNLWKCGICGKSFHSHLALDKHISSRHANIINAENSAICLADYCDIFRCQFHLPTIIVNLTDESVISRLNLTQYEIFYPDLGQLPFLPDVQNSTQLSETAPVEMMQFLEIHDSTSTKFRARESVKQKIRNAATRKDEPSFKRFNDLENLQSPTRRRSAKSADERNKKLKSDVETLLDREDLNNAEESFVCDPLKMDDILKQCEDLLDMCTNPLKLAMEDSTFDQLRDELFKASCWYMHCDRYRPSQKRKTGKIFLGREMLLYILLTVIILALSSFLVWWCFGQLQFLSFA